MAIQAMALGVEKPAINALGAFHEGAQARQTFDSNQITLARQGLETIGSIALGAMGGDLKGQADPALFEEGLDYLAQNGVEAAESFRGRPDLAPMVARASLTAMQQLQQAQDERSYQLAMEKFQFDMKNALAGPGPTAAMQNFDYATQNPGFAEFINPAAAPSVPSGYEPVPDGGGLRPIPGGPADTSDGDRELSAAEKKELFEAQDAIAAGGYVIDALKAAQGLSGQAMDGAFAGERATIGANVPNFPGTNDDTNNATIQYKNIVTELALNQLKTVFGGMPTEGERKILLEIQGSVDQPKAVRDAILKRAEEMALRRILDAQAKAEGIRTGQYMQPGYGAAAQPVPGSGQPQWEVMGVED